MPTITLPTISEDIRTLPGDERIRQLHRFIDYYASDLATAALKSAAARESGVAARVLTAAAVADAQTNRELVGAEFLALVPAWISELRRAASCDPDNGACTVATALKFWLMTVKQFRPNNGAQSEATTHILDELAEALTPLLPARCLALDVAMNASSFDAEEADLRRDLSHVYAAHASAVIGATCAELVFGYRRHLVWDAEGCASCWSYDELDDLDAFIPGFASGGGTNVDTLGIDGVHPAKRGPCANFKGLDTFMRLRNRLDACLTGSRIAKDRAAALIARSMTSSGAES